MKKKISDAPKTRLRHQAEAELSKQKKTAPATDADTQRLIHELEVHQIKLEMQNEELVRSHAETEAALHLYEFAPIGLFTLAHDGGICQVNQAGANLLGADAEREKLIKRRFGLFVSPKFRPAFTAFLDKVFLEGAEKETCEVELLKDKTESLWAHIEAVRDHSREQGEICHAVVSDITERKQAEESLRQNEERFQFAIRSSFIVLAQTDRDARYTWIHNPHPDFDPNTILGKTDIELADNEGTRELFQIKQQVIKTGIGAKTVISFPVSDGSRIFDFVIEPVRDAAGQVMGVTTSTYDITERKQAEEALHESKERFKGAFEHSPIGMALISPEGKWLQVNSEVCSIVGYSEDELLTKTFQDITHPDDMEIDLGYVRQMLAGEIDTYKMEKRYFHKEGHTIWVLLSVALVKDNAGSPLYFISQIEDITERKRAEEALVVSEEKWRLLVKAIPDYVSLHDSEGRFLFLNHYAEGFSEKDVIGNSLFQYLAPKSLEPFKKSLENCQSTGTLQKFEHTAMGDHGVMREYEDYIVPIIEKNGSATTLLVSRDITERKQTEEALVVSEEKWRSLVKAIPDYVSLHDSEGRFLFLNHYAEGFSEKDVIGNSLFQYLSPKSLETFKKSLENCQSTGTLQKFEHTAMGDHGVMREYEDYIVPIIEKNGSATTLLVSRDITERKQTEEALKSANEQLNLRILEVENLQSELREQALHEPLTGLYNRRYLNETLSREITRAERENDPLSVIMSDIDHFKMINDTYGHPVGDKFLVEIASLMKNHARSSDIVCRYGGEEFLLVLPSTTLDAAEKRAEELRQKCAEIVIQHEGKDLKVTMSFGVATYPDHGKESEEIITKADKALYRAKVQGRNCTVRFE